jgi:hypothetical protein
MNVDVAYTVPTPQPDVTGCKLTNVTIDPGLGTWSGQCQRTVGGVQSSFAITDVPITLADMTTICDILIAAAQATVPPQIKAGTTSVTP